MTSFSYSADSTTRLLADKGAAPVGYNPAAESVASGFSIHQKRSLHESRGYNRKTTPRVPSTAQQCSATQLTSVFERTCQRHADHSRRRKGKRRTSSTDKRTTSGSIDGRKGAARGYRTIDNHMPLSIIWAESGEEGAKTGKSRLHGIPSRASHEDQLGIPPPGDHKENARDRKKDRKQKRCSSKRPGWFSDHLVSVPAAVTAMAMALA